MTRRPTVAHALALQAAKAATALEEQPEQADQPAPAAERADNEPVASARRPGRPRGKREVEARLTLYLDARRHDALRRLATDRGRSIHSLIVEAVDAIIRKPTIEVWK